MSDLETVVDHLGLEEFDLLGAPYADRGTRADDALRALRASLGRREPRYHGSHHRYEGFVVNVPEMRLYYYEPAGPQRIRVYTYPVGVGR